MPIRTELQNERLAHEQARVAAARHGAAAVVLVTAGLAGDGVAAGRCGGVGPVPALPRRRLLDLHAVASGVDGVARPPVARAQLPVRLERHGDDLLHHLAPRGVADDGGATCTTPNFRIIFGQGAVACSALTEASFENLLRHRRQLRVLCTLYAQSAEPLLLCLDRHLFINCCYLNRCKVYAFRNEPHTS